MIPQCRLSFQVVVGYVKLVVKTEQHTEQLERLGSHKCRKEQRIHFHYQLVM